MAFSPIVRLLYRANIFETSLLSIPYAYLFIIMAIARARYQTINR